MEQESKSEKFKRTSGLYALKSFIFGTILIVLGIILNLLLKNNLYFIISATGLLIVLWAISKGNTEEDYN